MPPTIAVDDGAAVHLADGAEPRVISGAPGRGARRVSAGGVIAPLEALPVQRRGRSLGRGAAVQLSSGQEQHRVAELVPAVPGGDGLGVGRLHQVPAGDGLQQQQVARLRRVEAR